MPRVGRGGGAAAASTSRFPSFHHLSQLRDDLCLVFTAGAVSCCFHNECSGKILKNERGGKNLYLSFCLLQNLHRHSGEGNLAAPCRSGHPAYAGPVRAVRPAAEELRRPLRLSWPQEPSRWTNRWPYRAGPTAWSAAPPTERTSNAASRRNGRRRRIRKPHRPHLRLRWAPTWINRRWWRRGPWLRSRKCSSKAGVNYFWWSAFETTRRRFRRWPTLSKVRFSSNDDVDVWLSLQSWALSF